MNLTSISVFSYAAAAVAFLSLFVLLLTSWRGRMHGMALTIACLLTVLWASTIACQLLWESSLSMLADILEIFRNAGWSFFLVMLLWPFQQKEPSSPLRVSPFAVAIAVFYLALLFATVFLHWDNDETSGSSFAFLTIIIGRVAMAVVGMILVEQFYRNTPVTERWGIKYLCLGIGGMFAYDLYLYSDGLLFRHVNDEIWAARGFVNAVIVPFIAVSAARNPQWSLKIAVSRRILFHSATLFGAAVYLLAMATAGYFLRFFGGSWGGVLQATFLFGSAVLLVGVLFSGTLRSRLKVFISKHFFSYNYDYREEWLRLTRALSEDDQGLGERTIRAVAELVESPGGGLWIRRESGNFETAAHWNMSSARGGFESVNSAFCQFMENRQWVINIQEYEASPDLYETFGLPQWLRAIPKAWLVVPLIQHQKLFGFVVLAESRSKIRLNWEINDLLKIAGNQAASYLAQQEAANALLIARQFESFNRMSTFVVHDLKNLVSQLSLMLSNIEKHKNNPEFQKDMINTVDLSVQKMKRLLEKLSSGISAEKPGPLAIDNLLVQVVAAKSLAEPKPMLEILDPGLQVFANGSRLERVIGHLIQNAIEATPKNGQILVRLTRKESRATIEVRDTGQGMSVEFVRERLFKPFQTTKTAGVGIGVFECQEYARELGGDLEVVSSQSSGTTFRMILPLHDQAHTAEKSAYG